MDRGAWWVLVHSITKGRTRLKCLSTQTFILRLYLFLLPITALCPHFSPLYNLDARLHIYSCCLTSPSNPFLPSLSTVITFKTLILIKSNFSHSSLLFPSSWAKKKKKAHAECCWLYMNDDCPQGALNIAQGSLNSSIVNIPSNSEILRTNFSPITPPFQPSLPTPPTHTEQCP